GINAQLECGEDVLPSPLAGRVRILPVECTRHGYTGKSWVTQIGLVALTLTAKVILKPRRDHCREHGDAILVPLPFAHQDLALLEVDVLHAQTRGLREAKT